MEVITAFCNDIGNVKKVNQDSLSIKVFSTTQGKVVFAMVCDGMGGLEQGELASKEVILALNQWFESSFLKIVSKGRFSKEWLWRQWEYEIAKIKHKMKEYGSRFGVAMGTTLSALLIYQNHYYVCHVGDSRIYRVCEELEQLTEDHTYVAREVRMGRMTVEQAEAATRRNVLTQCVGTLGEVYPQLLSGEIKENTTFLLCTDGLIHTVSEQEIGEHFAKEKIQRKEDVEKACRELTWAAMQRGESDNITVVGIVVR